MGANLLTERRCGDRSAPNRQQPPAGESHPCKETGKKKQKSRRPGGRSRARQVSRWCAWPATRSTQGERQRQPASLPQRRRWRRWRVSLQPIEADNEEAKGVAQLLIILVKEGELLLGSVDVEVVACRVETGCPVEDTNKGARSRNPSSAEHRHRILASEDSREGKIVGLQLSPPPLSP